MSESASGVWASALGDGGRFKSQGERADESIMKKLRAAGVVPGLPVDELKQAAADAAEE